MCEMMEVNEMPKNSADPKMDRADNRADKKDNQQNNDNFTEEAQTLTSSKAADYVPNLNGIPKNES
jgi:hypothetical protein